MVTNTTRTPSLSGRFVLRAMSWSSQCEPDQINKLRRDAVQYQIPRFRPAGPARAGQKSASPLHAPAPAWSPPRICQIVVELRDAPCREVAFPSLTRGHVVCHMRSDVDPDNSQSGLPPWWID